MVGEPLSVHDGLEIFESFSHAGIIPRRPRGRFKMPCPKCGPTRHNPKDPSLSVNMDEGWWRCHNDGCGWKGKIDDKSWRPGQVTRSHERSRDRDWMKPKPLDPPDETQESVVRRFFEERRHIPWEVVLESGVTWGTAWMPQFPDQQVPTIQFPYYRDGELVNVKYRGPRPEGETNGKSKTFRMESGAERIWYGLDWCVGASQVYIVEGEIDALSLRTLGLPVLSVPDGAPNEDAKDYATKFEFMGSGEAILTAADTVVIAVDDDAPGKRLAEELARRIGKEKCFRVVWPDGVKDANEMLVTHGPDGLRDVLSDMQPWPIEGIIMPMDLIDEVLDYVDHGLDPGFQPPWDNVAKLMRPAVGQTMTITGVPSHGKSSFAEAMAVGFAMRYGLVIGLCSPEHWPPQRCLSRLASLYLNKPLRPTDDGRTPATREELRQAMVWVNDHFRLILPSLLTIEEIFKRAEVLAFRDGIQMLVIDPWTSLRHDPAGNKREDQYIADVLSMGREFARNRGVFLCWSAHPTKQPPVGPDGEMPIVGPYHIKGGTAWADFSDFVLTVYRKVDEANGPTTIKVWKVRFPDNGHAGTAKLAHDRWTGRYMDYQEAARAEQYRDVSRKVTEQYARVGDAI